MPQSRQDLAKQTYSLSKMKHPQLSFITRHKIPISATIGIAAIALGTQLFNTSSQTHQNEEPRLHHHIFSNLPSCFNSSTDNAESWSSTPTWRI